MDFVSALFLLAIIAVIFALGRELFCWYWKINKIVDLLEEISHKFDLMK